MKSSHFLRCLTFLGLAFVLLGCASPLSSPASATMTAPARPASPTSTRTPRPRNPVYPTPITLEHQGNDEYGYCIGIPEPPRLLVAESQGLSEDEIAEKMMRLRLDFFSDPKASDYCRIEAYRIDKISAPEPWMLEGLSLPPRSFLRVVDFSIKLHQPSRYWFLSLKDKVDLPNEYEGTLKPENWLQTSIILVVYELSFDDSNDFYGVAQIEINP